MTFVAIFLNILLIFNWKKYVLAAKFSQAKQIWIQTRGVVCWQPRVQRKRLRTRLLCDRQLLQHLRQLWWYLLCNSVLKHSLYLCSYESEAFILLIIDLSHLHKNYFHSILHYVKLTKSLPEGGSETENPKEGKKAIRGSFPSCHHP